MEVKLVSYRELLEIANEKFRELKGSTKLLDWVKLINPEEGELEYFYKFDSIEHMFLNLRRIRGAGSVWQLGLTKARYTALNTFYLYGGNKEQVLNHLQELDDVYFVELDSNIVGGKERVDFFYHGIEKYKIFGENRFIKVLDLYRLERFLKETIRTLYQPRFVSEDNFYLEIEDTLYVTPEFFLKGIVHNKTGYYDGGKLVDNLQKLHLRRKRYIDRLSTKAEKAVQQDFKWFRWVIDKGMSGFSHRVGWYISDKNTFLQIFSMINKKRRANSYKLFLKHLLVANSDTKKLVKEIEFGELKEIGLREKELISLFGNNITNRHRLNDFYLKVLRGMGEKFSFILTKGNLEHILSLNELYKDLNFFNVLGESVKFEDYRPFMEEPDKALKSFILASKDISVEKDEILPHMVRSILGLFREENKFKKLKRSELLDFFLDSLVKLIKDGTVLKADIKHSLSDSDSRYRFAEVIAKRKKEQAFFYISKFENMFSTREFTLLIPAMSMSEQQKILYRTRNEELKKLIYKTIMNNSRNYGKKDNRKHKLIL